MENINTHGIKINMEDLKNASDYTERCYNGYGVALTFDMETGEICKYFLGPEDGLRINDDAVINLQPYNRHYTQQQLADLIYQKVCEDRNLCECAGIEWPHYSAVEW